MSTNTGMQELIGVINKLQDAFTTLGMAAPIDLPQIAVVGGQSAGKSSVLENFVGKDFLPRGSGIVTRRPLVLQLIHSKHGEWGEFLHAKGKKFTDFDAIRMEIEAETNRLTGSNKGISPIPINLRVYSPHVLDLTLVDLPGMTKVPVGDQPPDIEKQIKEMLYQFITKENCLILAVTPANSDLANSDALQVAKEVDPTGIRTIGVLTKLDLMDEGTDAREILDNKVYPLRRGYVGVVNRGQKDIEGKKDIRAALAAERKFFLSHQSYRTMSDRLGTPYLQRTLNQQLTNHIRDCLPALKTRLSKQLAVLEKDVEEYKKYKPDDPTMKTRIMMQLLQKFESDLESRIEGKGSKQAKGNEALELQGGAKISYIFRIKFPSDVARIGYNEKRLRHDIGIAIKNNQGIRGGIFAPDEAFEQIVKVLIDQMKEPSFKCIDLVMQELNLNIKKSTSEMSRFPKLQEEVERISKTFSKEREQKCKDQISLYFEIEAAYVNTNHPDFIGFKEAQKAKSKGTNNRLQDQVLQRGLLTVNLGISVRGNREYLFILTSETLSWYKDMEEKEQKYNLNLNGLRFRELESTGGFMRKEKLGFVLYATDKRPVFRDKDYIELHCHTMVELEEWKSALHRAGIQTDNQEEFVDGDDDPEELEFLKDPAFEKDVSMIQSLVDSYMGIISKTVKDIVPKTIMHIIVNQIILNNKDNLMSLYGMGNTLMEESQLSEQQRKDTLNMYHTTKEALDILSDITTTTISTDVPPPISLGDDPVPVSAPKATRPPASTRPVSNANPPNPSRPTEPLAYKTSINRNTSPQPPVNRPTATRPPPVPQNRPAVPQRPN